MKQTVKQNQVEYGLPLKILSYNELYGWTMDKIVEQIGKKNNCELKHEEPGIEEL
jgi:cytoplasmic tRNA 2-thiolation protein 1